MKTRNLFSGLVVLACLSGAAHAQAQDASQTPPAPNETKHAGDWLVRCFPTKSPTPCDMIYILAIKKTGQMMLSMRMTYAPSQDKQLLMIGVPLGVSFAKGLVVSTDQGATSPMPYQHCDRTGCYVSSILEDAAVDQIAKSTAANTKVTFSAMNGKNISLPFPLNGFAEARQSMVELAKGRATAAPAATPPKKS